jgi:hypothetical protein
MVIIIMIVCFFQETQGTMKPWRPPGTRETTEKKRNWGTRNPDKAEKTRRNCERHFFLADRNAFYIQHLIASRASDFRLQASGKEASRHGAFSS